MKGYDQLKKRADELRQQKGAAQKRLREIDNALNELTGTRAEALATRSPLELAVFSGNREQSELDELDARLEELAQEITTLEERRDEERRHANLCSSAITQIQRDAKANFHEQIWSSYEKDFNSILREFESACGRLMLAQLGRTKMEGDLLGIIQWLVRRGELRDPSACFRDELERLGVFSNV